MCCVGVALSFCVSFSAILLHSLFRERGNSLQQMGRICRFQRKNLFRRAAETAYFDESSPLTLRYFHYNGIFQQMLK